MNAKYSLIFIRKKWHSTNVKLSNSQLNKLKPAIKNESEVPSKHLLVLKTSWRRLEGMSWRRLEGMSWRRIQHVFSVTLLRLPRRLESKMRYLEHDNVDIHLILKHTSISILRIKISEIGEWASEAIKTTF